MNPADIVGQVPAVIWWLIPIFIIERLLKAPSVKGYFGELQVRVRAHFLLDKAIYHRVHDVTLPTPDGTTQIDHVFVSRYGLFVLETKNMRGWIFGGENKSEWTQTNFSKKVRFQNPLRQNYKHVKALEAALQVPPETMHSVVNTLVVRKTQSGPKAGKEFWGCSGYPKCRMLREIK